MTMEDILSVGEPIDPAVLQYGPAPVGGLFFAEVSGRHHTIVVNGDTVVIDPPSLSPDFVSDLRWEVASHRFRNAWENKWDHLADIGLMLGGGIAGGLLLTLLFLPVCGAAAPLCAGGVLVGGGGGYWLYETVDNNLRASQWINIGQEIGSIQTVEQGAGIWAEGILGDVKATAMMAGGMGALRWGGPRLANWWRGRGMETGVEVLSRRPAVVLGASASRPEVIDLTEVGGRWIYAAGGQVVEAPPPFPTVGEWGYQRPLFAVTAQGWRVTVPEGMNPAFAPRPEMAWFAGGGRAVISSAPKPGWVAAAGENGGGIDWLGWIHSLSNNCTDANRLELEKEMAPAAYSEGIDLIVKALVHALRADEVLDLAQWPKDQKEPDIKKEHLGNIRTLLLK